MPKMMMSNRYALSVLRGANVHAPAGPVFWRAGGPAPWFDEDRPNVFMDLERLLRHLRQITEPLATLPSPPPVPDRMPLSFPMGDSVAETHISDQWCVTARLKDYPGFEMKFSFERVDLLAANYQLAEAFLARGGRRLSEVAVIDDISGDGITELCADGETPMLKRTDWDETETNLLRPLSDIDRPVGDWIPGTGEEWKQEGGCRDD